MESNEPGDESPRDPDDPFWQPDPSDDSATSEWLSFLGDMDELSETEGLDDADEDDDFLSTTAPLPLPPEDRLWRHPSELRALHQRGDLDEPTEELTLGSPRRSLVTATVAAGLTGALLAGAALWLVGPARQVVTERVVERQMIEPSAAVVNASMAGIDVVAIAEAVKPSIVRVEIFNRLDTLVGSGSGVIFRDDGHVLTNAHVIDGASEIDVVLSDGRRYDAETVGADPLTDVAVVKIDAPDPMPAVLLGSTASLRVGETAVAVGSPLRLAGGPTVTVGVVSAIGRTLDLPDGGRLFDLVQTDAPISPGSSGGALLDGSGALIGLTTVMAVSDVGAEGLGFATPVEIAYDVAVDLVLDGEVHHGFLGVGGDDLTSEQSVDLALDGGAMVTAVGTGTPAERAGIAVGDVIVAVDDVPVVSMSELIVKIRRREPGDPTVLTIVRDSAELRVSAELSERPG